MALLLHHVSGDTAVLSLALLPVGGVALMAGHFVALLPGPLLVGVLVTHLPRLVIALRLWGDGLLDRLTLFDWNVTADRCVDGVTDLLSLVVRLGLALFPGDVMAFHLGLLQKLISEPHNKFFCKGAP